MAKGHTVEQFLRDLAFEVDWLVYTAVEWDVVKSKSCVVHQDATFLHARNLLEFAQSKKPTGGALWIASPPFKGGTPAASTDVDEWQDLINWKVTHLGGGRLKSPPYPVEPKDGGLIVLARLCLDRINEYAPANSKYGEVMHHVADLGLAYIAGKDALDELDALTV